MSRISTYSGQSPYGLPTTMAHINIDTLVEADIELVEKLPRSDNYTIHFWIKSNANSSVSVSCGGTQILYQGTNNEWSECLATFYGNANDRVTLEMSSRTVFYLWHPKLERGKIATDFSESTVAMSTSIVQTANEISLLAEKTIGDGADSLKSQLNVQAGNIAAKVSATQGDSTSSFAWDMKPDAMRWYANGEQILKLDQNGGEFNGVVKAEGGSINGNMYVEDLLMFGKEGLGNNFTIKKESDGSLRMYDATALNVFKIDSNGISLFGYKINIDGNLIVSGYGTSDPPTTPTPSNGTVYFKLVN